MKATAIKEGRGKTWAPQTAAWREEGKEEEESRIHGGRKGRERAGIGKVLRCGGCTCWTEYPAVNPHQVSGTKTVNC